MSHVPDASVDDSSPSGSLEAVLDDDVVMDTLRRLVDVLGGQHREPQELMSLAVARAVRDRRPTFIEAPTGTGKTVGYLVPAALASGSVDGPVVVATVKKSLQEQLLYNDLPLLTKVFPGLTFANLKGRGNYLCRSKVAEVAGDEALFDERVDEDGVEELLAWASETDTGDQADAPDGTTDAMWRGVSVSGNECPGASNCRFGSSCFAEAAKERAYDADIVVTNLSMLLLDAHLAMTTQTRGTVVPNHSTLIIDEAHSLHEQATNTFGIDLRAGRFGWVAGIASEFIDQEMRDNLTDYGARLNLLFDSCAEDEKAVDATEGELAIVLSEAAAQAATCRSKVMAFSPSAAQAEKREMASAALKGLIADIGLLLDPPDGSVAWCEAGRGRQMASLRMAYVDMAPLLREHLFDTRTVVMTSATMTVGGTFDRLSADMGLTIGPAKPPIELQVPSPFDFQSQGRLFVPKQWPNPRHPSWRDQFIEQTWRFIEAGGGRAMVLFTSWSNLNATVEALGPRCEALGIEALVQGSAPPGRLIERMRENETSVLFGVASFWEGVDVPGDSLLTVIIDKIPFPRPGEPLMDARRKAAEARRESSFHTVDIPKAATLLAQGVGRLIRRVDDVGVVAVMDSRLATKSYRQLLLNSLPDFKRTIDASEVEAFLSSRVADL